MHKPVRPTPKNAAVLSLLWVSLSLAGCSLIEKLPLPSKPAANTVNQATTSPTEATEQKADPQTIKTNMDAGNRKAQAGQWQEAATEFQKVLAADPRYAPAHVQLGWVYAELKQWDDAKRHLQSAVALKPDNAGAHANLAWVYAENQHWNDAQQEAKKAIDLDPKNPYAHATLAWAYQSTGQNGLAIAEYEKSVELKPDMDNSRLALGITYCNQGNMARAKEQLKHLEKLNASKATELQTRINKGCSQK